MKKALALGLVGWLLIGSGTSLNAANIDFGYATGFDQKMFTTDEINQAYGNIMFSETDLALGGSPNGMNIAISRTYNSRQYKSNPTMNITLDLQWGAWAGKGWSFSFAKRAFIVKTFSDLTSGSEVASSNIILEGNGGFEYFNYESGSSYAGVITYKSSQPGNLTEANWDGVAQTITIKTETGQTYTYSQHFYTENHISRTPILEANNLIEAQGYFLTHISDIFGNTIQIHYAKYNTSDIVNPESDKDLEEITMSNIIGVRYQDMFKYNEAHPSDNYYISSTIQQYRPISFSDDLGRVVDLWYSRGGDAGSHLDSGISWNASTQNAEVMVSKITYTNVNGTTNELKYKYNDNGTLSAVQLNNLPEKQYFYKEYMPVFRFFLYVKAGWPVYSHHSYSPDWSGEYDYYNTFYPTAYQGYLLEKRINPLGSVIFYVYTDSLEKVSNRYAVPNGTHPTVIRKVIYQDNIGGNPTQTELILRLYYPLNSHGYPDMASYEIDPVSRTRVYYYNDITVKDETFISRLPDVRTLYTNGMVTQVDKGTLYSTHTNWDYANNRINYTESYIAGFKQSKIEYASYDAYNNPLTIKLYKGTSSTPYTTTEKVYYPSSEFDYNAVRMVKKERVYKDGQYKNQKFYKYTRTGKLTSVYDSYADVPSSSELKLKYSYYANGRLATQRNHPRTSYVAYIYNEADTFGGYSAISTSIQHKDSGTTYLTAVNYQELNTGLAIGSVDANYHQRTNSYDNEGRLTSTTEPDGSSMSTDYTNYYTQNKYTINANGRVVQLYFDNFRRTTGIDNPTGEDDISYMYYFGNQASRIQQGTTSVTVMEYDDYLRPTLVRNELGQTTYTYSDDGTNKKTTFIKTAGGTTIRRVVENSDELGQLTSSILQHDSGAGYSSTSYSQYNVFGAPHKITDALGYDHKIDVDPYGKTTTIYAPTNSGENKRDRSFTYTRDNLLEKVEILDESEALHKQYEYIYDRFGRMGLVLDDGVVKDNLIYDETDVSNGKGQVTTAKTPDVMARYHYDNMGRLSQETVNIRGSAHIPTALRNKIYTLNYGYKQHGGLDNITFDDGKNFTYDYNATTHQLTQIKYSTKPIISYTYNTNGTIDTMTYGNNFYIKYLYQNNVQVTNIIVYDSTNVEKTRYHYTYNANGNITSAILPNLYKENQTTVRNYTYFQPSNELTQVEIIKNGNTQVANYAYDKNGNALTFSLPTDTDPVATTHTINQKRNQITQKTGYSGGKHITFEYDPERQLTRKTRVNGAITDTIDYVYNYQNQIVEVKENTVSIAKFGYDTARQRIYSDITKSGYESSKYYIWDLSGRIIAESTPAQKYIVRYIYSGNEKVAMVRKNAAGQESYFYFVNDAQGTSPIIMDEAGRIISRQMMDEWGNLEQGIVGSKNEINYTGKKFEAAIGLYYFNQRWYDPEIGRFLTEDPAGQSLNPYLYCRNNPLSYLDPTGLKDWSWNDIAKTFEMATRVVSTGINMANGQNFNEAWTNSDTAAQIGKGVGEVFTGVVQTGISLHVGQSLFGGVNLGNDLVGSVLTEGGKEGGNRLVQDFVSGKNMSLENTFNRFKHGFIWGGFTGGVQYGYRSLVGFNPTLKGGHLGADATKTPGVYAPLKQGYNHCGFPAGDPTAIGNFYEGTSDLSKFFNALPGGNAVGTFHDALDQFPIWQGFPNTGMSLLLSIPAAYLGNASLGQMYNYFY